MVLCNLCDSVPQSMHHFSTHFLFTHNFAWRSCAIHAYSPAARSCALQGWSWGVSLRLWLKSVDFPTPQALQLCDWATSWAGTPRARLSKPSFLTHALSLKSHAPPRPTDSARGAADLHHFHLRRTWCVNSLTFSGFPTTTNWRVLWLAPRCECRSGDELAFRARQMVGFYPIFNPPTARASRARLPDLLCPDPCSHCTVAYGPAGPAHSVGRLVGPFSSSPPPCSLSC